MRRSSLAAEGVELVAVVTGDAQRAARAGADHPAATVHPSADALLAVPETFDLLVVAAPNDAHEPLARARRRARQGGRGRQADGADLRCGAAGGRRGARRRDRADRVPEPALGQRPAHPATAGRGRVARAGAPVRVAVRALAAAAARGVMARGAAVRGRRRPAAGPGQPSRRPGAAPVRTGSAGLRGGGVASRRGRRRRVRRAHPRERGAVPPVGRRPRRCAGAAAARARQRRGVRGRPARRPGGRAARDGSAAGGRTAGPGAGVGAAGPRRRGHDGPVGVGTVGPVLPGGRARCARRGRGARRPASTPCWRCARSRPRASPPGPVRWSSSRPSR